ncbi:MAG: 50S ribosomal protein L28 [Elusimicrobia bacterium]|nr:50S ribosomal protein L28 [Elusimicrobiota bacterium]
MSFKCSLCGKAPVAGRSVSHSHKTTNRRFLPNLQRQRILVEGVAKRAYVCTGCIKSGKVVRPS